MKIKQKQSENSKKTIDKILGRDRTAIFKMF